MESMNNLLAGLTGYETSAPLGLPEGYGLFCIMLGISFICIAAFSYSENETAEIVDPAEQPEN